MSSIISKLINLAGNITGTLPVANGGTGVTTSTGTTSVVLSNGPTLVAPVLGTPASGNLSNCTSYPNVTQSVAGLVVSAGQLLGTNTNDSAASGKVGEFISATGTQTTLSTTAGTYTSITSASVSLTAGDWMVAYRAVYDTNTNTGTGADFRYMYLQLYNSTDSALLDAIILGYANATIPGANRNRVQGTGMVRVSLAATKTVILRGGTEEVNSATTQAAPTALAPSNDPPYIKAWRIR